jgi:hypothetical protein
MPGLTPCGEARGGFIIANVQSDSLKMLKGMHRPTIVSYKCVNKPVYEYDKRIFSVTDWGIPFSHTLLQSIQKSLNHNWISETAPKLLRITLSRLFEDMNI